MSVATEILSPFKGLAPFQDADLDALLFFGRERERAIVTANLMASRLTVLYGPTGVGKSSLLRAGVAHGLREIPDALVVVYDSWSDPIAALSEALGRPGASLADAAERAAARVGDVYVILDQFEEFFLYHDPAAIAGELGDVLRRPGLRANVLIGIREDSLARLDDLKAELPSLLANRLRLEHLDRRAAETAIVGPLDAYNRLVDPDVRVEIEPQLVQAILDQVVVGRVELGVTGRGVADGDAKDRIEAPYLQLVLERLWEVEMSHGSRRLRLATLGGLGGAAQIVEQHLERAMAQLSPEQRDAAAAMYDHLVTPSGTKIAHRASDLAGYASLGEPTAREVLDHLARERILRATSENGAATMRYEIYHDVLAGAILAWRSRHEEQRILRRAHEQRRRALRLAAAALLGLLVVGALAVFALVERSHSNADARRARARELAAAAVASLATDPQRSVRLALDAARLEPKTREEDVLRQALIESKQRAVLPTGGPVVTAEFDPTGHHVMSASKDGKVRIYRVGSTQPERRLHHGAPLFGAVYSGDGRKLVSIGRDRRARIWNTAGGRDLQTLDVGGLPRTALFARRDTVLVALAQNGVIRVWRTRDGRLVRTIRVRGRALPKDGAVDPSGRLLATVGHDRYARVYSLTTGRLVRRLAQKGFVGSVVFSKDGSQILTSGNEGTALLWNASTGALVRVFRGPGEAAGQAVFSPDGRLVAAASSDGTARVWETATGFQLAVMIGHENAVTRVAFSRDGAALVTGSSDGTARTWVWNGRPVAVLAGHTGPVNAVAFSPDGRSVVTAGDDGTARLWDPGTEPELARRAKGRPITSMTANAAGSRLLVVDDRGRARVRLVANGRTVRVLPTRHVTAAAFGPRGPVALSAPVRAIAFSADGRASATARGRDVTVRDADG